ncbi:hypothetical protein N7519_008178 [Penicillium mononematosum]|uniref:uncharacterized protein n=1 Tax=Penicillium mononematosum TaxID=268346 RepID=UPI002548E317|nr:uncharacterized protein N7519_008178 [Penicillium mononematosum]KAJ6177717.1 hypothetical protein N7519_008178 [Penicillium mononematosum]
MSTPRFQARIPIKRPRESESGLSTTLFDAAVSNTFTWSAIIARTMATAMVVLPVPEEPWMRPGPTQAQLGYLL